jgi:hypothetical protein
MIDRSVRRIALSLVLVGGLALVGAWPSPGPAQTTGGSVQEKLDRLEKMTGAERQRFLEAEALKEGRVVMYTADDPVLIRLWSAAFKKRYPQLDVQFVRMTAPQTLQRAMAESQAGRPVADLLDPDGERAVYDADEDDFDPDSGGSRIRLPLFHQLDVRIDKTWTFDAWMLDLYLDVLNTYDHRAIEGSVYSYDFSQHAYFEGLPVVPTLGLKGSF